LRPPSSTLRRLLLVLIAAILTWADAPQRPEVSPELAPSDWFGAQRAFPRQAMNQDAYMAAVQWARVERMAASAVTAGPIWTEAGPFNIGGRITALAATPGGATVYAGAAAGGVFKSTNGGVNWTSIFDHVPSIGALALDPSNTSVLYVGTGEANAAIDNYDGEGLFRSSDAGQTWNFLGLRETRRIARIAVDPQNPDRVFVAAMGSQYSTGPDRGLYRTQDGGLSWTKVLFMNDSTGVCDVVVNPAHPETVFCATWERIRRPTYRRTYGPSCGIWRSVDHGTTWTRLLNGLPAPSDNVGRIGLALAPSSPSTIYAQIIGGQAQSHNGLGLYWSTDAGTTWARRDGSGFTNLFGGFGWYFGDMAVDPINPNRVFCLGQNIGRSLDGGANFTQITSGSHFDHHAIWMDPSNPLRTYVGTDGGFYSSLVGGGSWNHSTDLPITQFYAGAVDPSNASRILGGTQDNGSIMTTGSPIGWFALGIGGDGFYCAVDPTDPNIVFAEWQNCCGGTGPRRSTNGGSSFGGATISGSNRFNWNTPFVMDPNDHNILLVGSHRVHKSANNGLSYSTISNDLTRNQQVGSYPYSTITTLEIAKANSSYYYVGTDDGRVWRSTNAGGTWTEITAGLPLRWVTRVSADPTNAAVVYVTLSGYSQDEYAAHVYRSTNAGDTWTAIDGNLPDVPANDLIVDPLDPNRLYLANDVGVYTSRDLGLSWYPLGLGLPINPVVDLTLHAASRTLVAATHGRSQWKLDLTQLAVNVPPAASPVMLSLSAPRPNPSREQVRLALELSRPGHARVQVFDAFGRRVTTLMERDLPAGRHPLSWDGRDARGRRTSPGAYFVRAAVEGAVVSRRVVRL
jgi:photosystem II stability/assembly factor-like uncharacterized protein